MACPICGEETRREARPFCSRRCADVDLRQWLTGGYSVPVSDLDETEETLDIARESRRDI